jgi:hypothetical protein
VDDTVLIIAIGGNHIYSLACLGAVAIVGMDQIVGDSYRSV